MGLEGPKLSVELLRKAVKLLKAEPMCMQRLTWIDSTGMHSRFYGHRARLAAKKARRGGNPASKAEFS